MYFLSKLMRISSRGRIILIVIVGLLIPIGSFSVYQLARQKRDEKLIRSIYERQLSSILFSVNQHSWDVFESWNTVLRAIVRTSPESDGFRNVIPQIRTFLKNNRSLAAAVLQQSSGTGTIILDSTHREVSKLNALSTYAFDLLNADTSGIQKAIHRARNGYVRPLSTEIPVDSTPFHMLVFPLVLEQHWTSSKPAMIGLIVDDALFATSVVARKFDEMNDGSFAFAVSDRRRNTLRYSSEDTSLRYEKNEASWLLPHLDLMVRLHGATLDELSRRRNRIELFLLITVNAILLLGIAFLVKSVFTEMSLAQQKSDFVANVSHELRTPLSLISMHVETLEMGRVSDDTKRRHYYRVILGETRRLAQLVNNILDFFRIESHRKEYHLQPISLDVLIENTLEMYRFHLQKKGIELHEDISPEVPEVMADPDAISLAIVNLLDNAVKFSGEAKRIDLSIGADSTEVVLAIRDFGIGIPLDKHSKIFDKFYRVESSLVHATKGSGLGLSLVKHIMEQHHGRITFTSKPGKGSTFRLHFPIKRTDTGRSSPNPDRS